MANISAISDRNALISDYVQLSINLWLMAFLGSLVAILSGVTNLASVIIFANQGLNESMRLNLFCLALCDLCAAVAIMSQSLRIAVENLADLQYKLRGLTMLLAYVRCVFVDLGTGFTVFISIERCACVTFPFNFKTLFNLKTTRIAIVGITVFVAVNYIPLFATLELEWQFDNEKNMSSLNWIYTELNHTFVWLNDVIFGVALSAVCQSCVFVCAVFMLKGLRDSWQVRTALLRNISSTGKQPTLSNRERQLVKMVFLVAICYLFTGLTQVLIGLYRLTAPEINNYNANLVETTSYIVLLLGSVSGAANFFIYLRFNSSYRVSFLQIFSLGRIAKQ